MQTTETKPCPYDKMNETVECNQPQQKAHKKRERDKTKRNRINKFYLEIDFRTF